MLIFVLALQSPAASSDWGHVSRLCERTLRSVCQQTIEQFEVILVGNRRPSGSFTHPRLTFLEEDFPIPRDQPGRMHDKWLKIKRGLIAARPAGPAHVMITDADDCVHRGLAALSVADPDCPGWTFETGYLHDAGSRWVYRLKPFDQYCGTSAIVRLETHEFPGSMDDPAENYFLLRSGHRGIKACLAERGTPLRRLDFVGAIYNAATGENHTQISVRGWRGRKMLLKKLLNSRPLTGSIRRAFGLYELS